VVEGFAAQGVPTEAVDEKVFHAISDTQTPQGILVVLPHFQVPLPPSFDFVLILDAIQDPGNLGTILRTAAAAGVQVVFLTPGTVDPFSPKVVRAAMGAHFHLPIHSLAWEEIEAQIYQHSLRTYLASPHADTPYTEVSLRSPLALIIGSEAEGASDRAKSLAHIHIRIPMPGATESLNASVAAAILIFEVVRQRSHKTPK
jgi:TrmH family RNA methyltransferase